MPASVLIAASGVVTNLGAGAERNINALREGQGRFSRIELNDFEEKLSLPYLAACNNRLSAQERSDRLLDEAINEVLSQQPLPADAISTMPVFIGSSSNGIGLGEEIYRRAIREQPDPLPLPLDGFTQISRRLRDKHGFNGADFSYNTACTASANALLGAVASIRHGGQHYALVVGLESFNTTTLAGFHGMQLLSSEEMRPFCKHRAGLVLGEGCSVLLLRRGDADESGFHLLGGASRCDTYSISASNPDGSAIADLMNTALSRFHLNPQDIVAIKAHGTASPLNDDGEAAGMRRVFDNVPDFFSMKSCIGHTLGSCGAIETALLASCIQSGFLPASAGFKERDPALGLRL